MRLYIFTAPGASARQATLTWRAGLAISKR